MCIDGHPAMEPPKRHIRKVFRQNSKADSCNVTIPKALLKPMGLAPGSHIEFTLERDGKELVLAIRKV